MSDLRHAVVREPSNPEVLVALALRDLQPERIEPAAVWIERGVAVAPGDFRFWIQAGKFRLLLGRRVRAGTAFRRAGALQPSSVDPLAGLAMTRQADGELGQAAIFLERASAIARSRVIDELSAEIRLRSGDIVAAARSYDRALALSPDDAALLGGRANVALQLGQPEEAHRLAKKALAREPSGMSLLLAGEAARRRGDALAAVSTLQRFTAANAGVPDGWSTLGQAWRDAGFPDQALSSYDDAIALSPLSGALHNDRGNLLRVLGRGREAVGSFRRAVALSPASREAHHNIAGMMQSERRRPQSFRSLARAHALRPDAVAIDIEKRRRVGESYRMALRRALGREAGDVGRRPPRLRLPDVTLCCIDTAYHALSAAAMLHCLEVCDFDRAILVTDRALDLTGIEVVRIPPLAGGEAYSRFVLKDLHDLVGTSSVLMVQYDGFILDADRFEKGWLGLDYIGAPWVYAPRPYDVGNGGFSFRSKHLLAALRSLEIPKPHPEDVAICLHHRPVLESDHGIAFADRRAAARFSLETGFAEALPGTPFGFHGVGNLWYALASDGVDDFLDACPERLLSSDQVWELLTGYFASGLQREAASLAARLVERMPAHADRAELIAIASGRG